LSFKGFGESKPLVENNSEKGRATNRRTEFFITKK
jgi:flagellar motor protein MotB